MRHSTTTRALHFVVATGSVSLWRARFQISHACPPATWPTRRDGHPTMAQGYPALMILARAIAAGDTATALALLAASPELATARLARGATRQAAKVYCLDPIGHYFYAGQTALHVAAAAYQCEIADKL